MTAPGWIPVEWALPDAGGIHPRVCGYGARHGDVSGFNWYLHDHRNGRDGTILASGASDDLATAQRECSEALAAELNARTGLNVYAFAGIDAFFYGDAK